MNWHAPAIKKLLQLALQEDRASRDVTSLTLIHPRWKVRVLIQAKQPGVVAGLPLAGAFFRALDPRCRFQAKVAEGTVVRPGMSLAVVKGRARAVLSAERPALNALQHLSGIATYTRRQIGRLGGGRTRLYDTRKTLPGWRVLQKYAVRCGGGINHRLSLADAIIIKDNHLKVCRLAGSDWAANVRRLMRQKPSWPVQLEIQTAQDLRDALRLKPHRVLLDNLPLARLRRLIRKLRARIPRLEIEISGGVRPEQLRRLSRLGVERVSMGRLTHSAPAFDCSLEVTDVDTK